MIIEFSKEVSNFIESNGSKSGDYYMLPYYFKKVRDGFFEVTLFKDVPNESLKHIVEQSEPRNEEE